jgi:hypothetical protein
MESLRQGSTNGAEIRSPIVWFPNHKIKMMRSNVALNQYFFSVLKNYEIQISPGVLPSWLRFSTSLKVKSKGKVKVKLPLCFN